MAHHETIDLLTRFKSAILQEASINHSHDKIPVTKALQLHFLQHQSTFFCRQSKFCTFKRTCCTVSWFGWQFRLSHEHIKHIGSAAKTTFSPVDMSCRCHRLVELISVVCIQNAVKHGDKSRALHKGCCLKSI